jgi:ribosomal protein S14
MGRFLDADALARTTPEEGDETTGWCVGKRTSEHVVYTICERCGEGRWVRKRDLEFRKTKLCRKCIGYETAKKNLLPGNAARVAAHKKHAIAKDLVDEARIYPFVKARAEAKAKDQATKMPFPEHTHTWHTAINKAWRDIDARLPQLIHRCYEMAMQGDLDAMKEIFNRRFGKVPDKLAVDASGQIHMTAETMAQALARAQAGEAEARKIKGNGNESIEQAIGAISDGDSEGS